MICEKPVRKFLAGFFIGRMVLGPIAGHRRPSAEQDLLDFASGGVIYLASSTMHVMALRTNTDCAVDSQ
jgi:hypothetical protein